MAEFVAESNYMSGDAVGKLEMDVLKQGENTFCSRVSGQNSSYVRGGSANGEASHIGGGGSSEILLIKVKKKICLVFRSSGGCYSRCYSLSFKCCE